MPSCRSRRARRRLCALALAVVCLAAYNYRKMHAAVPPAATQKAGGHRPVPVGVKSLIDQVAKVGEAAKAAAAAAEAAEVNSAAAAAAQANEVLAKAQEGLGEEATLLANMPPIGVPPAAAAAAAPKAAQQQQEETAGGLFKANKKPVPPVTQQQFSTAHMRQVRQFSSPASDPSLRRPVLKSTQVCL